jgi:hypothetical protein
LQLANEEVLGGMTAEKSVKGDIFLGLRWKSLNDINYQIENFVPTRDNAATYRKKEHVLKPHSQVITSDMPTYSQFFNSIESFFGLLKKKVRNKSFEDITQLIKAVNESLYEINILQITWFDIHVLLRTPKLIEEKGKTI